MSVVATKRAAGKCQLCMNCDKTLNPIIGRETVSRDDFFCFSGLIGNIFCMSVVATERAAGKCQLCMNCGKTHDPMIGRETVSS